MSQILIVDDESGITTILKQMFMRLNYGVLTAASVAEALETLAGSVVDLVVTDMVMPGGDGLDLIASVQSEYPGLKVIAISGGGGPGGDPEQYLQDAKEMGADRCLRKPFMLRELASIAKEVLGEAA